MEKLTARQMLRQCQFMTSDGKTFVKKLHNTYELKANIISNNKTGTKTVLVKKYNRGYLTDQKKFDEGDFAEMQSYCNTLTF